MGIVSQALWFNLPSVAASIRKLRHRECELWPPRWTFARSEIHKRIKVQFNFTGGTFFEVGANDGLNESNTAYLERYKNWRGLLVEPLPNRFSECIRNRPNSIVTNAALVASNYQNSHVEIAYANLMSLVDDPHNQILTDHLAAGRQFLREDAELCGKRFSVPVTTVSRLLNEHKLPQIDFFSLDVEGYELEVLKGIDFVQHRPRYFLIEVWDKVAIDAFMATQGYCCEAQWTYHDYLYTERK